MNNWENRLKMQLTWDCFLEEASLKQKAERDIDNRAKVGCCFGVMGGHPR